MTLIPLGVAAAVVLLGCSLGQFTKSRPTISNACEFDLEIEVYILDNLVNRLTIPKQSVSEIEPAMTRSERQDSHLRVGNKVIFFPEQGMLKIDKMSDVCHE